MLLVNCLSHPSSYVAQEVMMDGDTAAPAPHDATYYIDLAKSIDDDVSYADTAVFNDDMSMETFVAVIFKRGGINLKKFWELVPQTIEKLRISLVTSPVGAAKMKKSQLNAKNFPDLLYAELERFIDARECWPHIVCRHRHIFAFPSCYNDCRLPVFHFERVLAVSRAPSLCVWKTVHFSCPREETLFTTRRVYLY
jgi:hypothetical protein